MNTFTRLLALLAACLTALAATAPAAAAAAADGAEKHGAVPTWQQGLITFGTTIIVFGIVLFVLGKFVWPNIAGGLDDRANKIRDEIAAAELSQKQAKAALDEYEKNLADARAEAQRMIDEAKTKQQQIAAQLKAEADVELSQMRERATKDIETAKRAAINEIYSEATNTATMIAGKILQREISADDQRRLVEESLQQLQSTGAGNGAVN